jgi:hypothetical protein
MIDLKAFKQRQRATSLTEITESYQYKGSNYVDSRYWKLPTPDKKDGAYSGAIIRFLPSHNPEKPFITTYSYSFNGINGQYIEESLETLGKPDPVQQYNSKLWSTGDEDKRADTKKRSRKLHYIGNILVVKDPTRPDNEGKVFLFKFGVKIYEKLLAAMQGDEMAMEAPIDIFDLDEGANFSLNMTYSGKTGFFVYDKSKFLRCSSIGDEDYQEIVVGTIYDLDACEPVKYKTFESLKERFDAVMTKGTVAADESQPDDELELPQEPAIPVEKKAAKVKVSLPKPPTMDDEFAEFDSLVDDDIPF